MLISTRGERTVETVVQTAISVVCIQTVKAAGSFVLVITTHLVAVVYPVDTKVLMIVVVVIVEEEKMIVVPHTSMISLSVAVLVGMTIIAARHAPMT